MEAMIKAMAQVAHEVNRGYCEANGDYSQDAWVDAAPNIRQSAVNGVEAHLKEPGLTPKESHDKWMAFKEADGWVYGDVKDPEAKTHPSLVPYEELSIKEQTKDYLFKSVVSSMSQLADDQQNMVEENVMHDVNKRVSLTLEQAKALSTVYQVLNKPNESSEGQREVVLRIGHMLASAVAASEDLGYLHGKDAQYAFLNDVAGNIQMILHNRRTAEMKPIVSEIDLFLGKLLNAIK